MTSPAQQMQFSAAPPERLLRSAIRRMRPYIASDPGFMEQNARGIVADLRQTFPDLAPPEAPLGDAARIFSKAGLLKLGTFVGPEKIADIRAHFADKTVVYENENRDYVGEGPVDAAPANTFVANHGIRDILTCPHLVDIANDPAILSIVRGYLGFEPIIDTYSVWHSYAGRGIPGSPQTLHRDKDCFRFCKLFVYLSDVDEESGPHVYLPNSHRPDRFAELYRASTNDQHNPLQFFVGGQRNHAAYLEQVFAGRFEHLTGPAGSSFLVNTYGLHKGEPPKSRNRMLFQVLYTLLPYGDVMGTATGALPLKDLPTHCAPTPDFMYRNQLYIC